MPSNRSSQEKYDLVMLFSLLAQIKEWVRPRPSKAVCVAIWTRRRIRPGKGSGGAVSALLRRTAGAVSGQRRGPQRPGSTATAATATRSRNGHSLAQQFTTTRRQHDPGGWLRNGLLDGGPRRTGRQRNRRRSERRVPSSGEDALRSVRSAGGLPPGQHRRCVAEAGGPHL